MKKAIAALILMTVVSLTHAADHLRDGDVAVLAHKDCYIVLGADMSMRGYVNTSDRGQRNNDINIFFVKEVSTLPSGFFIVVADILIDNMTSICQFDR